MATISILSDIDTFTPVFNRMEVEVLADAPTLALTGMRYMFDVYIENVSSPAYHRYQVTPDPDTSVGYIDVARYCESAVHSTLSQESSVVPFSLGANANGTQSIIKVTIKYGYSYYNAGVYTAVPDITVGSAKYAFFGALTERVFIDWNATDYLCNITNGANAQFLTDMKTHYVSLTDLGWTHILTDIPTDIDSLVIKTYDSSDNLIATNIKSISVAQNLTSSRMYKVATGPESLNNMTGSWVSGGPNPIITSSVSYYEILLVDVSGNIASETLTFHLNDACRYEERRVHFLNRLGSFDAYNFNLRSQTEEVKEMKSYKYNKNPITAAGISRSMRDQSQVVNYVKIQEYLTVRSDYLTKAQNDWLKQLVQSPEIYLEITDGAGNRNFLAYEKVETNNWIEKDDAIDKLFILELKLKLSQTNYLQRR